MRVAEGIRSAFAAGVVCANSAPHLVTAMRRRRMMTPLAGPESGPWANFAWGLINAGVGSALVSRASRRLGGRSGGLRAFAAGATAFVIWAVVYESVTRRRSH